MLSSTNGIYKLRTTDSSGLNQQIVKLKDQKITQAQCSCEENDVCPHIAVALLTIRSHDTNSKPIKHKNITNQAFIDKIEAEELQQFVLSRMKADKSFKTILKARFLLDVFGHEHFEDFLDKSFPPNKTTNVRPAQKEVKLFQEVVEELQDQIKDLVGRDNYVDASIILVPLIKKSFYFKNRFQVIPERFLSSHLHLVEILNTIYSIIEAPSLRSRNAQDIIKLLELSYVQLIHQKEKDLIINILKERIHNDLLKETAEQRSLDSISNPFRQFLIGLIHICSHKREYMKEEVGAIFIELFSWYNHGHDYFEELIEIANNNRIPVRFIEKLITLETGSLSLKTRQSELALKSIAKYKSFSIFKWVISNERSKWEESKSRILELLKENKEHTILIQILIHEKSSQELFDYLNNLGEIRYFHQFLTDLTAFSEDQTFHLYTKWIDSYMMDHFGNMALDHLNNELRIVERISLKLKRKLDKYILKKYGERPSLSS